MRGATVLSVSAVGVGGRLSMNRTARLPSLSMAGATSRTIEPPGSKKAIDNILPY